MKSNQWNKFRDQLIECGCGWTLWNGYSCTKCQESGVGFAVRSYLDKKFAKFPEGIKDCLYNTSAFTWKQEKHGIDQGLAQKTLRTSAMKISANIATASVKETFCLEGLHCFIFWKCPWGNINDLQNLLQHLHPKIKFTMEHSFKEPPFLDILIKNKNSQIITDIYHKPPDTQQYLHFKSYHPQEKLL